MVGTATRPSCQDVRQFNSPFSQLQGLGVFMGCGVLKQHYSPVESPYVHDAVLGTSRLKSRPKAVGLALTSAQGLLGFVSSQDSAAFFDLLAALGCTDPSTLLSNLDKWIAANGGQTVRHANFFIANSGSRQKFQRLSFSQMLAVANAIKTIIDGKDK